MSTPAVVPSHSKSLAERIVARLAERDPADMIDLLDDEALVELCLVRRLATLVRALPIAAVEWLAGEGAEHLPACLILETRTRSYEGSGIDSAADMTPPQPSSDEPADPPPAMPSDSRRAERSESAAPSLDMGDLGDVRDSLISSAQSPEGLAKYAGMSVERVLTVLPALVAAGDADEQHTPAGPVYRQSEALAERTKAENAARAATTTEPPAVAPTIDVADVRGALMSQPQTAHEIAKFLSASKDAVNVILRELVAAGEAVKSGTGKGVKFAASDALLAQRDASKFAKADPPPAAPKRSRAAGPVAVTDDDLRVVFGVLTDRKGGAVEQPAQALDPIVVRSGLPRAKVVRSLEILSLNGRCFTDGATWWRDSGPEVEIDVDALGEDEEEEDEAPAPTDPAPAPKGPSGATEERVLLVLRHRDKLRGQRTPLEEDVIVCDAATMGGAGFDLLLTRDEMPALLARLVEEGKIVREGKGEGFYALPERAPEALPSIAGAIVIALRHEPQHQLTAAALADDTGFSLGAIMTALDDLIASKRIEKNGSGYRLRATTDGVLAALKDGPLDVQELSRRLVASIPETRALLGILVKSPKRVSTDEEGRWRLIPVGPSEIEPPPKPKTNGRRTKAPVQTSIPGA